MNTISHSLQVPLNSALDTLERKLEESGGPFLCGGEYTLADCLFTCVLARLGLISMLGETFKNRKGLCNWILLYALKVGIKWPVWAMQ